MLECQRLEEAAVFKIGAVAQLTGLSPNGIRFYEERRLVEPPRVANGRYRNYSAKTLSELMDVKNYRGCGFSLDETSGIIGASCLGEIAASLDRRIMGIERERERLGLLEGYMAKRADAIRALKGKQPASLRSGCAPSLLWLPVEQGGAQRRRPAPRSEVRAWLAEAPLVDSCLLFQPEALSVEGRPLESCWGLAIESDQARAIGLAAGKQVERLEGGRCAIAAVEIDEALRMTADSALRLSALLRAEGLVPSGPMISRRLVNLRLADGERRFDELIIPLEGAAE